MLETLDLDARLSKEVYSHALDELDRELGTLQRALSAAAVPVVIVFEGWDAAGKGAVLSRLLQALDPRGFKVHPIQPATEAECMWPPLWRFWRMLPNDGEVAIFDHSWYQEVADARAGDGGRGHEEVFERIRAFERQLVDHGTIIAKFFLHISQKEQRKRFKALKGDPAFAWRVGKTERKRHKQYDAYLSVYEEILRETSTAYAPWTLVASTHGRFANVKVAESLVSVLRGALEAQGSASPAHRSLPPRRTSVLDRVDLSLHLEREKYSELLPKRQLELRRLQHLCYQKRVPVVIVYEGWDAAGKGGNIRRFVRELDPRGYAVLPYAAPRGEEKTHHYLWRFWRSLPKAGHFALFDRSWYGRVLVERVEGFASPEEWMRAYQEINEFEEQLTDYGTVIVKFWIHVSKDEQIARFEARKENPEKEWKITDEDWRNREKWDEYWDAVSDMIERTSTPIAPWTVIEGNDKRHARIRALDEVIARVQHALDRKGEEL
jgi:AMP-polyphosphate phosphotransferase